MNILANTRLPDYKQLLARVCSQPEYGSLNKTVVFAPVPTSPTPTL